MKILGIYYGHNATVGLLEDGKVVFCQSEERLNRMKNSTGFPFKTVEYVKKTYGADFDLVLFPQKTVGGYLFLKSQGAPAIRYQNYFSKVRPRNVGFMLRYLCATYLPRLTVAVVTWRTRRYEAGLAKNAALQQEAKAYFAGQVGVPEHKLRFLDHHESHALSLGFLLDPGIDSLVFTLDGEGDDACATVSRWQDGKLTELGRTQKFNSIGYYYLEMTGFLGMKPNEDEFKLMGLAPYAKQESAEVKRVYDALHGMLRISDAGDFVSAVPPGLLRYHFLKEFLYTRFDHLAAGMQQFLEDRVVEWVRHWTHKTGIRNLAVSGGVFMNVKLNQRLLQLEEVDSVIPMPSAADESTVFGCLYAGWQELTRDQKNPPKLQPLADLYLGTAITDSEIVSYLEANTVLAKKYTVKKHAAIDTAVADILARGGIVARATGRMEWGARGLGNRSILADPRNRDSVRIINEMIKSRDFWMPFAPSVLEEDFDEYFKNPKEAFSPYMTFAFDATEKGKTDLVAALHAYDQTGRPQLVRKTWNPGYYKLIAEFKRQTGIGGVLNTSFNLHGHPVARTVHDAFEVMEKSALPHLALGSYLVSRK